jgi:hypothetical protein
MNSMAPALLLMLTIVTSDPRICTHAVLGLKAVTIKLQAPLRLRELQVWV